MLSIKPALALATLLASIKLAAAQELYVFLFLGEGLVGSVSDASGCNITYVLTCDTHDPLATEDSHPTWYVIV